MNRTHLLRSEGSHPHHKNPRKYPFHTIITGMVMMDGRPRMAFGNIQAYSHVTHLVNTIDLGMNPQASADAARYLHEQAGAGPGTVQLEPRLRALVGQPLAALGHPIETSSGLVGGFQAIVFDRDPSLPEPVVPTPQQLRAHRATAALPGLGLPPAPDYVRLRGDELPVNGVYRGASDPRKDGHAAGW